MDDLRPEDLPTHPSDTPLCQRISNTEPCTSNSIFYDPVLVVAADEMAGKFVGPLKPANFFKRFLPEAGPLMPSTVQALQELEVVAAKENEIEMYEPFIIALRPFCGRLVLCDTSAIEDSQSGVFLDRKIRPDIMFYDKDDVPLKPSAALARGHGEFKIRLQDEPFALDGKTPFETDALHSRDTRGQITLYANAIQALQYRTHSFSFFINGSSCRLIHWSKSQAVVTEPFDYTKEDWLPMFFWRLGHSTKSTCGIDSFSPVTDNVMANKARKALGLLPTDPLYQVSVTDDVTKMTTIYI
ncbi:hypothetical protein MPER_09744, partial [Moniliophthora perniciosa FA553]